MKTLSFIGHVLIISLFAAPLNAQQIINFDNPEDEIRYHKLITELRCLVCQNQSLADSNAELAQDLKKQVITMINQKNSDEEIISFMVKRYGDFVLYSPPIKKATVLLWFGPFIILSLAGFALVLFLVRRNDKSIKVSEQQRQHAAELLKHKKQD